MNDTDFAAYKSSMRTAIRATLKAAPPRALDEAGFPAYSHPNPLINWLFWQRLRKTMQFIEQGAPYLRVLDFGCGSGVMLPFLCRLAGQVSALDLDLSPFRRMQAQIQFPANLELHGGEDAVLDRWPAGHFQVITALDVLEHVHDLAGTLDALLRLLAPRGTLVVSGPTENLLYRIGRRLAGREYSGDYHERGIGLVRRELADRAQVQSRASLYRPLTLFEIFTAVPR